MKEYLLALLWLPFIIVKGILAIIGGLFIVPVGLIFCEGNYKDWADIFWLWGNDEDGLGPESFKPKWPRYLARWWWLSVRNPVNNSRYLFKDTEDYKEKTNWPHGDPMEAQQMKQHGRHSVYRWRRKSWKVGYRKVWLTSPYKYSEIWIGWKLGSSVPGLGFSLQFRRKRDIGT